MTFALCYVGDDGIVFAIDSLRMQYQHRNGPDTSPTNLFAHEYQQKLYPVGATPTLAFLSVGLTDFAGISARSLADKFAHVLQKEACASLESASVKLAETVRPHYELACSISAGTKHDPRMFTARYYLGGWVAADAKPGLFLIEFTIDNPSKPVIRPIQDGLHAFGTTEFYDRLVRGVDDPTVRDVLASGKWNGSEADLRAIAESHTISANNLPIRNAVELVFALAHAASVWARYSYGIFSHVGGMIDLAVIPAAESFRWLRQKPLDVGIQEPPDAE